MKSVTPFNIALVAASLLLSSSCFALSNAEKQQKLEQLLASVNQPAAPGITVLVRVGDEVLLRRATGLANLEIQKCRRKPAFLFSQFDLFFLRFWIWQVSDRTFVHLSC